jgi:hypothetical protein
MENLAVGDRVRRRQFPDVEGEVWSLNGLYPGWIMIKWDDPDENAEVADPARDLEKITLPAKR